MVDDISLVNRWRCNNNNNNNDKMSEAAETESFLNEKQFDNKKLPMTASILRVVIFILYKCVNILYVPVFIYRIFQKKKVVPPVEDEILCISATKLTEKILNKEISCEEVIRRYITRIQEVNTIINAVINERFSSAIQEAKNIDKLVMSHSKEDLKLAYPLLGVPLTVKGSLALEGLPHTSGMIKRTQIAPEDAVAVRKARNAGAIPLLTSNIPELCLNWESTNKLVGTTNNPYNSTRTAGGSSGGEASLMGAGASLIGLGSDIAGSLRLPPHFCGTYGHKPTPGSVSYIGHYPSCKRDKEWTAFFTVGPMTRYAGDLRVLLNVIVEDGWREKLRLQENVFIGNIKVYYTEDINSLLCSNINRDTRDAFQKVLRHLSKVCGDVCRKIEFSLMESAPELASLHLLDIDDVDNLFEGYGEGSFLELCKFFIGMSDSVLTSILYGVTKKIHSHIPRKTAVEVNEKIDHLRKQFLEILDDSSVFVLPAFPAQAHKHGDVYRKIFDGGYMSIFNALGFPVTCGPVAYSKDKLPIGIQVVAKPNCDRLALTVTEELEKAFGGWHSPSTIR